MIKLILLFSCFGFLSASLKRAPSHQSWQMPKNFPADFVFGIQPSKKRAAQEAWKMPKNFQPDFVFGIRPDKKDANPANDWAMPANFQPDFVFGIRPDKKHGNSDGLKMPKIFQPDFVFGIRPEKKDSKRRPLSELRHALEEMISNKNENKVKPFRFSFKG